MVCSAQWRTVTQCPPGLLPLVIDNNHTDKALCYLLEPLSWGQCKELRTLLMVFMMALVFRGTMDALLISCVASLCLAVLHCYLILVDGALQGRVFVRPQQ